MGLRLWLAKLIEFHIFHPPQHIGHKILRKIAWWIHRTRWEPNNDCQVFVSHLREGMTVMDVGANLGLYSLLISRAIGPSGKVYAFEPVPEIFARLKEHIALNNATNVIPVPVALSDEKGTAKMSVRGVKVPSFGVSPTNLLKFRWSVWMTLLSGRRLRGLMPSRLMLKALS